MLGTAVDPTDANTPEELQAAYERVLSETIEEVGLETVADRTGVARERLAALAGGRSAEISLEDAAAILATESARPDGETITAEARDALLMGMTTAVLDVEALAAELDGDLGPTELQQKIEGRHPMTLAEFAEIRHRLANRAT